MRKTIAILTILLLVIFMVGCENSVNPTNSDTQNLTLAKSDGEAMSLAKKEKCATIQGGTIYASDDVTVLETGYDEFGYNYQAHMFSGRYCDSDRIEGGDYCDVKLIMKWNDAWMSNMDCDKDGKLDRHNGFDSFIGSGAWLTNHQFGEDGGCEWDYFVKIVAVSEDAFSPWVMSGDFVFNLYSSNTYVHNFHIETFNDDGTFTATGVNTTDHGKITSATGIISGNEFTMTLTQESWVGTFTGTIANNGVITGDWEKGLSNGTFEFIKAEGVATHITWYEPDGTEIGPVIWGSFAVIQEVNNDPCAGYDGLYYKSPAGPGLGNL